MEAGATAQTKKCPDCAELVQADAKVCRYCGRRFDRGSRWLAWLVAGLGVAAVVVVGVLFLTGEPSAKANWQNLSKGMTTTEVIDTVGEPDTRGTNDLSLSGGNRVMWLYEEDGGKGLVTFSPTDNEVSGVSDWTDCEQGGYKGKLLCDGLTLNFQPDP